MADAAESLPLPRSLLAHISDDELRRELTPRYEDLVGRMRDLRVEPQSTDEHTLVRASVVLLYGVLERLGPKSLGYLRSDVQGQLDALIRDELGSADATRKLALRHLQGSVEVVGKLVELGGEVFRGLPDAAIEGLTDEVRVDRSADDVDEPLDDDLYDLVAWWLSLSVALECTRGGLDDLTYWSRRAIEGSRRVEALLSRLAADVEGVRLQLRARWAWADWDEDDIEDEIRAWRELSESR